MGLVSCWEMRAVYRWSIHFTSQRCVDDKFIKGVLGLDAPFSRVFNKLDSS